MFKRLRITFYLVLALSLCGDVNAVHKTFKVGVFNSYPLIFQDNDGTIKGLYIDLLTEISRKEDIKFEYIFGTWQQGLERIKTGEVDMLTSVGYTEERAKYMDYCHNPILTVWGELYTLKSSKIDSLLDLSGRKIGVLQGDIFLKKFKELIGEFNIRCTFLELSSYQDVLIAVASGHVDAGIVDVTYGTAKFRELNLRPSGIVFNPIDIYFTTAKNSNQPLRDILDTYLAKWKNQDTSVYSQAKQKWLYGSVGAVTLLPDWLFKVLLIIGIIIPGSFAFIILLKFKVNQATNEIKIREDALRKSESLLRTLINTIPDLIWLKDINGVYLRCNRMFEMFFGAPEKEIVGRTDYDFVERELADFFRMNDRIAIEAGKPSINEEWITFAGDGRRAQLETIKIAMYEEDRTLIGILGIGRDITSRKSMENALHESESLYRSLVENSLVGVYIIQDNVFRYVNRKFCEIIGYTAEELIDKIRPVDITHPDDLKTVEENIRKRISGEIDFIEYIFRLIKKDRTVISVKVSGGTFTYKGRIAIMATIEDITETIKAQEELKESEKQYRDIFNNSIEGIFQTTPEGRFISVNPSYASIFGYDSPDAMIRDVHDIGNQLYVDPEDRKKLIKLMTDNGYALNFETQARKLNGNIIWVSINVRGIFDESGKVKLINGTIIDITEQKLAQDALRESEETFRALTENSLDVIMRFDSQCRHLYVNPVVEQQTAISPDHFIGKTYRELGFPEALCDLLEKSISTVFAKGTVERALFQIPNGTWIDWLLMPEFDQEHKVKAVITSARDFTEYRKLELQLQQAQKMETVGTLAGGLAHDFNNILAGITGPLSIINHRLESNSAIDKETLQRHLDTMNKSCRRATEIINELLSLTRKRDSKFEIIDLNESIKNVMKICENTFDKSIQIKPEYTGDPAYVSADPTQIEQVLLNLCVNSSHAMTIMKDNRDKWGGVLSISIRRFIADEIFHSYHPESVNSDYWLIIISDTGIGIKSENISRIFDPFFTTKDKNSGTGLGLAIVYSIIKNHQGFVTAYSEPDNVTAFNIYLPCAEKTDSENLRSSHKNEIFRGEGTILIVDDEPDVRNITKEFLEECGYDVLLAENGNEGLDIFMEKKSEIDAVILDMSMPYMSGKETYILLKEISPDARIIMFTGYKDDLRVSEVISLGANGVIQKPVDIYKLSEAVYNLLNVNDQE